MKREDLEVENEALTARLRNWAMWCRSNPTRAHCFSIEHRYRPPAQWEAPDPRIEIDILDAAAVEKCVIGLPGQYRLALKYAYVLPWTPFFIQVRKIGCHRTKYDETVRRAEVMILNVLRRINA